MIEMFPFGRRRFHFELEPLLDHCYSKSPRPLILCSTRDVLVTPRSGHHPWASDKVRSVCVACVHASLIAVDQHLL
jgi:predicted glycosyltransferase